MFYKNLKAFTFYVRPQGYTQCILVRNTECKQNICFGLFTRKPTGRLQTKFIMSNNTVFAHFILCKLFQRCGALIASVLSLTEAHALFYH